MNPDVLLVDEVLAVGDVGFRMKCYDFLLRLMDNGTSIIVVSHAVNQLSRITDRAIVLNHGKTIFDGSLAVGTGKYEHLLKIGQKSRNDSTVGKPSIESIRLTDAQGKDKTDFLTGDSLFAEITLTSGETICDARIIVAVESPSAGILGSFSTPYSDFSFDVKPPKTKLKLEMPNIPFLIGGYYLNFNFYGPKIADFYDKWAPGLPFKIIGPEVNAYGYGVANILKIEHKWELVKQDP
jgi:lipopolysaccharide transport system ATP-binding protein